MMNMNDDVIRKTNAYLTRFIQFKDVETSKEIRKTARDHGIDIEICIHIQDLALREYAEAISLFPDLEKYPQEHVQQLIDIIKNNA